MNTKRCEAVLVPGCAGKQNHVLLPFFKDSLRALRGLRGEIKLVHYKGVKKSEERVHHEEHEVHEERRSHWPRPKAGVTVKAGMAKREPLDSGPGLNTSGAGLPRRNDDNAVGRVHCMHRNRVSFDFAMS